MKSLGWILAIGVGALLIAKKSPSPNAATGQTSSYTVQTTSGAQTVTSIQSGLALANNILSGQTQLVLPLASIPTAQATVQQLSSFAPGTQAANAALAIANNPSSPGAYAEGVAYDNYENATRANQAARQYHTMAEFVAGMGWT